MTAVRSNYFARVGLVMVLLVAAIAVSSPRGWAAPCTNQVNRDINSYVLFAFDEMVIKGGGNTTAGPRGRILGGNVGVNGVGLFKGNPRLRFGAGAIFMEDGKQAVADTARPTSDHSVDQLFVNTLSGNPPIVPRTCGPTPFTLIDAAHNASITTNLPTCPSFSPGTSNITVASGNTLTLAPGNYGDVRVNDRGVLNLAAGVYNLKSLSLGKNVKVMTTDTTEVRIAQNVFMNTNPFIGPACGARFWVCSDGINNGFSVGFSQSGTIYGQWIVPNGEVNLGNATDIFGRIWAKSISSDFNINITFCSCTGVLSAGPPGVSLLNPTTLLSALPIINTATAAAQNVQVTAITLTGGTLTSPPSLPFNLGTIPADGAAVLNADFSGGPFTPGGSYALTVQGTYTVGGLTFCFVLNVTLVVPPAAPGSALLTTVTVQGNQVVGGSFPHQPLDFDDEVNPEGPPVPTAPFVPGTPTPNSTEAQMAPAALGLSAQNQPAVAGPIVFLANNGLGLNSGNGNGTANNTAGNNGAVEPSGASGGGVVFVTANWTAAYSTDGGSTFTQLDPTTIFPNDAVGFCCDQVVQYVPSIDRFIWLLQGTGYRLASASPAAIISSGGTAWTYWNLTPQVFGQIAGTGFDYPDLSVGNNSLYISWDAGSPCPAGCTKGFQVVRTSLAGIQAGGTIGIGYTDPTNGPSSITWGDHLMQDTGDEIFWAGHNGNTKLRVFSLAEGSNTYFWRDIGISSWANNAPTSTTPGGQDWLAKNFNGPGGNSFPRNGIIGATRSVNQLWFAWSAGTDSNFQQAHVEMVTLDRNNNFSKIQQVQIWNNSYAFAYPALTTDACTGEIGLSFGFGGNGNYENHVVGFWGDFIAYITTGSNVGTTRYGDYVTIRQQPFTVANPGNLFSAFGYGLNTNPPPGSATRTDIHYVLFGRPASSCPPIIK